MEDTNAPVVAVTLARMKLPEVPGFIRWGRPVEKLVRNHPGITLAFTRCWCSSWSLSGAHTNNSC